ncbi:MAG TPA: peroxidase [Thermoanaerobaculia bacterium]|nr:peroxidase [Thermoanaerobaculia bacterium]
MSAPIDPIQDTVTAADLPEIQGLLLRGYHLEFARHFVLQILDPAACKRFLGKLIPDEATPGPLTITSSLPWPGGRKPDSCLNIGFSWSGLQALGLPGVTFGKSWSYQAFKKGAAARAATVGDVGASDPATWFGCLSTANAPRAHLILSLFTNSPQILEAHSEQLRALFTGGGAAQALTFDQGGAVGPDHFDAQALPYDVIHFDYRDGISQPQIMGVTPQRAPDRQAEVPAWTVVLRQSANASYLFPTPSILARNSGFGAFRILEQDVAGFESFYRHQPGIDPELLAAKLCGRWRTGNPLALCPMASGEPLPEAQQSDFDYSGDPGGDATPIGSHTRRGNPRDSESVVSPLPDHRIIRRAVTYGPPYQAGSNDATPRGLVGYFIGANLEQQFEFIMGAWVNGQGFAPNVQPQWNDPLLGANDPRSSAFDFPPSGHVAGFDRFVTTRGGMYCLLPSIPALTWMSQQP